MLLNDYSVIFAGPSGNLPAIPNEISGIAKIECAYRLKGIEKQNFSMNNAIYRLLSKAFTAAGDLPSSSVLLELYDNSRVELDGSERRDLFGMMLESRFQERNYGEIVAIYTDQVINSSDLHSIRADYFYIQSLIAIGKFSEAIQAGLVGKNSNSENAHYYLHLCGLAARSNKEFDRAGQFFVDCLLNNSSYTPPFYALSFITGHLSDEMANNLYIKLIHLERNLPKQRPGIESAFLNIVASFATRTGAFKESLYYAKRAARLTVEKKISAKGGRVIDAPINEPDFLILGMPKCGTTSAYQHMCKHPHILSASKKEVHFFGKNFANGMEWYLSHFVNAEISVGKRYLTGEASPGYFRSDDAREQIALNCKKTRFLVFLRNPAARLISSYYQKRKMSGLNVEIGKFIGDHLSKFKSGGSSFLSSGIYLNQIKKWEMSVGKERLHVVNADELFVNPEKVIASVLLFVGVDPTLLSSQFPKANVGSYPKAPPFFIDRLIEFYREPNNELFNYLGNDFGWNEQRLY